MTKLPQDTGHYFINKDSADMVSDDLLKLLVCPMGKAPLRAEADHLVCSECGTRFSIKDGIPNMLIEEAELPVGCSSIGELKCVKSGKATA